MSDHESPIPSRERNKPYFMIVDAIAWSNYRLLDYWRHLWEINARPYASVTPEGYLRETVERALEVLDLTREELEKQTAKSVELTERLASEAAHLQRAALEAYRGLLETSIENLRHVEAATADRLETAKKQLTELQTRAAE
jgi:uncharacterized protein YnzC (UPF0291/DUF896 family)